MDTESESCTNEPAGKTSQPRKRGAPRGNINALKHGFYSKRFKNGEIEDLIRVDGTNVQDEIAMLRVITRRAADLSEEGLSPSEVLEFYNIIGTLCMRISTLLRTQKMLEGTQDPRAALMDSIEAATAGLIRIGKTKV